MMTSAEHRRRILARSREGHSGVPPSVTHPAQGADAWRPWTRAQAGAKSGRRD